VIHRPKEQGALLISALIVMTILAVLAAGVARVQGSRADIAAEMASGASLDDLSQIGLNLVISGLERTACHPENISGAVVDGDGRTSLSRTVTGAGSIAISFCQDGADCFATDWGVAGKTTEWVILMVSSSGNLSKSTKIGMYFDDYCIDPLTCYAPDYFGGNSINYPTLLNGYFSNKTLN
jgi:hypothetical protein